MENGLRDKRTNSFANTRSLLDFTMGILYIAAAVFLFFAEKLGFEMVNFDKSFRYIFGGICAVYGVWRIYRVYRRDYF